MSLSVFTPTLPPLRAPRAPKRPPKFFPLFCHKWAHQRGVSVKKSISQWFFAPGSIPYGAEVAVDEFSRGLPTESSVKEIYIKEITNHKREPSAFPSGVCERESVCVSVSQGCVFVCGFPLGGRRSTAAARKKQIKNKCVIIVQ